MGGITSSIGIFSGINTASLIDQLISIESRPRAAAQIRLTQLQAQQAAVLDINSRLLALGKSAKALRLDNLFSAAKATSTDSNVLTATTGANAALGSFNFIVNRLVTTDQKISRGFANKDSAAVGATEFTIEIGGGQIDTSTKLSELNGGLGVERGKIRITDSGGAVATVDLSTAVTVDDVLGAINSAGGITVTAAADGQGLRIEGVQKIENVTGSQTASSLGIAQTATAGVIAGDQILSLSANTPLSLLRDGAGVAFVQDAGLETSAVADFRITVGANPAHNIILGELSQNITDPETGETTEVVTRAAAATLGDVINIINEDTNGEVTASISDDGAHLLLTSASGENVTVTTGPSGRPTAGDLGLLGAPAGPTVTSQRLLAGINSTLITNLNGGSGLTAGDLSITTRDGAIFNLTLDTDGSLSGLIETINTGTGGAVTATLNKTGNGLELTDTTTGGATFQISGGAGDELNLSGNFAGGVADSGNLQSRYVSQATRLDDLNAGAGIGTGSFTIVSSTGAISTVNLSSTDTTVFDLLGKINDASGVNARINDTGDGILIEDTAGGSLPLTITDESGRVARNLNIAGEGDPAGDNALNGSFEKTVTFNATDTLQQVADKINNSATGVTASIINDGSGVNPFRLTFTAKTSGAVGAAHIDTKGFDLGLTQLTSAQDAVVFFGSADPAKAVLLTSSANVIDDVINGVSIDLNSTSADPVVVTVTRDTTAIETGIQAFVDSFNAVIDRVNFHGRFVQDTNERGALLGDGILQTVQRTLTTAVQGQGESVEGEFRFLFEAGVRIGSGGKLEFDAERFRDALAEDPEGVAELFSGFKQETTIDTELAPGVTVANTEPIFSKLGVLEIISRLSDSFTDSIDGILTNRKNTFDTQIRLQQGRIDNFTVQLDAKRARLTAQFAGLEQSLAQLQSQQSALGSLTSLIG